MQARCFHASPLAFAAEKVAMSRFDTTTYLPCELLQERLDVVKNRLKRPLTLSEKILYSHLDDPNNQKIVRGESYLRLRPDRVAMQVCLACWFTKPKLELIAKIIFFSFSSKGCYSSNGYAAVHLFWSATCRGTINHSLRPFDWSPSWRRTGLGPRQGPEQRGVRHPLWYSQAELVILPTILLQSGLQLPEHCWCQIRCWFLETRIRNHPSNHLGKLCFPWTADDRYWFPHTQWWWIGRSLHWCRWRWCCRCDGQHSLGT